MADSSGSTIDDTITVTISVINVDEEPTFDETGFNGAEAIGHPENTTVLDANPADDNNAETSDDTAPAKYKATDPEGGSSVTLSLTGADASKFELNDPATADAGSKVLAFKDKPDYETPGDSNRDNVYQVTVVASDGANSATRDVVVKVTDLAEDGKLEVTPVQPRVGTLLTATLTDSDGVSGPTWEWRRLKQDTCPVAGNDAWSRLLTTRP